jgi:hypothetical protein
MDAGLLAGIRAYATEDFPGLNGILVVRHGYIVHEEYYRGGQSELLELYFQTMSVLSALIGSALQQGFLSGVDQKLLDLCPEFKTPETFPPVKTVCIRHMLTMSSGLGFSTANPKKVPGELTFPLRLEPGMGFFLNSTDPKVLSIILSRVTGMNASASPGSTCSNRLGSPTGSGSRSSACGQWDGEQVLPPGWVEESTRPWQHSREQDDRHARSRLQRAGGEVHPAGRPRLSAAGRFRPAPQTRARQPRACRVSHPPISSRGGCFHVACNPGRPGR